MNATRTIRRSEVPNYLHTSELYLSLDEGEDEFSVPAECMKRIPNVKNVADLRSIFLTMRYWILKLLPEEVVQFLIVSRMAGITRVLNEFDSAFPRVRNLVKNIHELGRSHACNLSAKLGRVDFLEYCSYYHKVLDLQTLRIAAENGRMHCLTYCYDSLSRNGSISLADVDWSELVRKNNFNCIPYLVEKGVPVTTFLALAYQISSGKCFKYLHERFSLDCWGPVRMAEACRAGQLTLVTELHALGCPWDESAIIATIQADEGICFRFLIDQRGIPTSEEYLSMELGEKCREALDKYEMSQYLTRLERENSDIGRLHRLLRRRAEIAMKQK